jgi:hypothetical protein
MRTDNALLPALSLLLALAGAPARAEDVEVDVELVLAVDVSWSMDLSEQRIQREGYSAAFRSPDVQAAIANGAVGRVAVTYVEWAGAGTQAVVIPWTVIDTRESADAFAYRLAQEEPTRARRTSISAAIDFSASLFDGNGFEGLRQVIDVSGDGPNNQGRAVTEARDAALARGLVINGLPLMTDGGSWQSWGSIPELDRYYADCVTGGPGSFVIPVAEWSQFPAAVQRKLMMELAGTWPALPHGPERAAPQAAATSAADCMIGERMWQERQRGWDVPN